jgi:hypothetical protein
VTEARPLVWADDGSAVFFGVQRWDRKLKPAVADSARADSVRADSSRTARDSTAARTSRDSTTARSARDSTAARSAGDSAAAKPAAKEDPAGVEVWHARDVDIMPEQKMRSQRDRNRSDLIAWHLRDGRVIRLGEDMMVEVSLAAGQKVAIGLDGTPYDRERMFGPIYRDLFVIDVATGEKVKAAEKVEFQYGPSATGRYLLYLRADLGTTDTGQHQHHREAGHRLHQCRMTTVERSRFGVGSWLKDDRAVLLYDEYDIWEVRPDGSGGVRLTDGAASRLRHRRVWLDPDDDRFVDWTRPQFVTLYGERTKQYGYGRLKRGGGVERLVLLDKQVGRLTKAKRAPVYLYRVELTIHPTASWVVSGSRTRAR